MARKGLDQRTILQAATEIADSQGIENISLALLAQRLGVKSPSLYNHIEGLAGLRQQLALYGLMELKEALTKASIGKSGERAIVAIGKAYVSFVREHPGLYEATLSAPKMMDPKIRAAGEEIVELMLCVLEEFRLSREDALHTVRGFRSIVHGFASLEASGGFGLPLDMDESLDRLLRMYYLGLRNETGRDQ